MNLFGIIVIVTILLLIVSGCTTTRSTHDEYSTVVISERFSEKQPMRFVDPSLLSNEALYNHNYYIVTTASETARVTKDIYAYAFEGKTCVLEWGYIDDFDAIEKTYGYVRIVRCH